MYVICRSVYACLHVCKINVWGYMYVMSGVFLGHLLPYLLRQGFSLEPSAYQLDYSI